MSGISQEFTSFDHAQRPLVDLQKSSSRNFEFYVPGLISFDQGT